MFRKAASKEMKNKRVEKKPRQNRQTVAGLPTLRADVAGIDLGSEQHWVCAPALDGPGREVADFGGTTAELLRLAAWLKERRVESVAMESTGVYWIAPHEVLEGQGLHVQLVDTRHLAQVPGRDKKSDPSDCEWLQRLHSCGLLKGAFRPKEEVCMLRTLVRDKANLVAELGDWIRRMQKSLDQMNVRLHRAVSDVDGVTGMAILRAIVKGERDPEKLAELRDRRCRQSREEIAEQLRGHWREDHLFSLKQALTMYEAVEERIAAYDAEILRQLGAMQQQSQRASAVPPVKNSQKAKSIRKRGEEPKREALSRMGGVDLTSIDAIGVGTVEVLLSEWPRFESLRNGAQFRLPSPALTPQTNQRRQAVEEETTPHRQYPRRRRLAHGRYLSAPQSNGPRRLLPSHLSTDRRRRRGLCHRPQTRHSPLSLASVGTSLRG